MCNCSSFRENCVTHSHTHTHGANYNLLPACRAGDNKTSCISPLKETVELKWTFVNTHYISFEYVPLIQRLHQGWFLLTYNKGILFPKLISPRSIFSIVPIGSFLLFPATNWVPLKTFMVPLHFLFNITLEVFKVSCTQ